MALVYLVQSRATGARYIGQTTTAAAKRWQAHLTALRGGYSSPALQAVFNAHGEADLAFTVLRDGLEPAAAVRLERHAIATLQPSLNTNSRGLGARQKGPARAEPPRLAAFYGRGKGRDPNAPAAPVRYVYSFRVEVGGVREAFRECKSKLEALRHLRKRLDVLARGDARWAEVRAALDLDIGPGTLPRYQVEGEPGMAAELVRYVEGSTAPL